MSFMDFASFSVDNFCRGPNEDAHGKDSTSLNNNAFRNFRAGSDETIIFDDDGSACKGSRTPPMPTPPEIWQFFPICAHEPMVAHVSIIDPSPTYAPRFTNDGIKTAPGAIKAECRTTQFGTARNPALENSFFGPSGEFRGHFVPPITIPGAIVDNFHVI